MQFFESVSVDRDRRTGDIVEGGHETSPEEATLSDLPVPAELPVRLAARGIDVAILVGVDLAVGAAIGFGFDWLALGTAIVFGYFVLLDTFVGATVGKLVLGLRVIGPDGGHPSLRQSLIREAFTVVGAIPFVGPLLALAAWIRIAMTVRASPLRQGTHDQLGGGTRVIRR